MTVDPGGGAGWDDSPLDIQVPDDARELERDILAYHRELRAKRRRSRLRRLAAPFSGKGTIMPLLASILAVCLVAGAMLSVATFSPANGSRHEVPQPTGRPTTAASSASVAPSRSAPAARPSATASSGGPSQAPSATLRATGTAKPRPRS